MMKTKKIFYFLSCACVIPALCIFMAYDHRKCKKVIVTIPSNAPWYITNKRYFSGKKYTWENIKELKYDSSTYRSSICISASTNSSHKTYKLINDILLLKGWYYYYFQSKACEIGVYGIPFRNGLPDGGVLERSLPQSAFMIYIAPNRLYFKQHTKDQLSQICFSDIVSGMSNVSDRATCDMSTNNDLSQLKDSILCIDSIDGVFVQIFCATSATNGELLSVLEICNLQPRIKYIFLTPYDGYYTDSLE